MTVQLQIPLSGSALRDSGISRAITHADRVSDGWSDRALELLRRYIREVGGQFQAEDVRAYGKKLGLEEPAHKRAWGGVFVRAKKIGLIRCLGTQPVSTPSSHCANAGLWQAV